MDVQTRAALTEGGQTDGLTALSTATAWWLTRLGTYEFMPNDRLISADVCTWVNVYETEYVVEFALRGVAGGGHGTWYKGRVAALQLFTVQHYDSGGPCIKLRMRANHSTFKACGSQLLEQRYKELLRNRATMFEIEAAKADMRAHRAWWGAQRNELDRLRRSSDRNEVVFDQADACGEDCLYVLGFPRVRGDNAALWQYQFKLEAGCFPGSNFALLLVPPQVRTCTSIYIYLFIYI